MAGKRTKVKSAKKKKKKLGFTNCLAIWILLFLTLGLAGGFYLALESIRYNYMGALVCYTAAFAPVGTIGGVVIGKIVDKNKAENTGGNGDGIVYAAAKAAGFNQSDIGTNESPAI